MECGETTVTIDDTDAADGINNGDGNENNAVVSNSAIRNENHCPDGDGDVARERLQIDTKPYIQNIIHRLASNLKLKRIQKKKKRVPAPKKNDALAKKFKCDQCDYASAFKSRVNAHARGVHSTEKLFNCEQCSMLFKYKRSLANHMGKRHNVILL